MFDLTTPRPPSDDSWAVSHDPHKPFTVILTQCFYSACNFRGARITTKGGLLLRLKGENLSSQICPPNWQFFGEGGMY